MKKLLSVLLVVVMLFSVFTATPVMAAGEALPVVTEEKAEISFFDDIIAFFADIIAFITDLLDFQTELPDVSEWTDEEIIEYYKKAARKAKWAKPEIEYVLNDYSFDGNSSDGDKIPEEDFAQNFPVVFEGINEAGVKGNVMGDYKKLTVDDCKSIKAYTEDDYTVIEIRFKEQFDSVDDSEDKITVSHGMLDFGKLTPALSRFNMMGMTMKINDATADYSNAIAKVRINSSGKVEYGTWLYDALCLMNVTGKYAFMPELSLEYDMMMDVSCTMTLGGGF